MSAVDDLLDDIFDGTPASFVSEFETWVRKSRRFRTFAASNRTKIRSKLRNAANEDRLLDVWAELETAMVLLHEKRFAVEYETYNAAKQRGPDFTVTFKTHTFFNVEVRRIRGVEWPDGGASEAHTSKLITVLCDKVGQMPPSMVNFLWVVTEGTLAEADVLEATTSLRQLADGKVEEFFNQRGFESAAAFLKQYRRLSGIVVRQMGQHIVWLNPIAQHKAPPDVVRVIQRLATV